MRYTDYEAKKAAALEILRQRPLYNAQFKDAKDTLNGAFESAYDAEVQDPFFFCGRYQDRPEAVNELTYSAWSLHRLPGLLKKVHACESNDPAITAMVNFLNSWDEAYHVLVDAKRDAIKGRRPVADSERKTAPRTLENTGTCACCGRNVKLLHGRIVDHGFQLQFGMRRGNCFGVNYHPWEKSPDGKIDYAEAVRQAIKRIQEDLEYMQMEPDADARQAQRDMAIAESELRFARKTLALLEEEIRNWTAQPLPGEQSCA